MPGSITPLPVMLEDEEDRKVYENLEPPKSIVVRYGYQKMVAELPYNGTMKPGCGSKLVIRSRRGIEMGEMLTSTCPNAGCGKSVSRKEMLQYIENSGGKDYPFTNKGEVLRIASAEDLTEQSRQDARKPEIIRLTKPLIRELELDMRLVDVELLLGGERIVFYYTAEQWIDFRELVKRLAAELQTRIEMRQVNAREEARVAADYEKCGQHCCCKQFLKVLKPVSMRSAKVQKATLDPLKISGRCGRLMCCLRYEDETYEDLRKRLPHRKTLVETQDGPGEVLDTQILTQLVLVRVGHAPPQAYPLEEVRVLEKEEAAAFRKQAKAEAEEAAARETERDEARRRRAASRAGGTPPGRDATSSPQAQSAAPAAPADGIAAAGPTAPESDKPGDAAPPASEDYRGQADGPSDQTEASGDAGAKRRRRRRRRGGRGGKGRGSASEGGDGGGGGA
ncbi:MAG: regulatory iron-sulfur-containing complex subunit RicT [Phycisphaeraceae bacterium]